MRTAPRIAAFMPGASPPLVTTPMILNQLSPAIVRFVSARSAMVPKNGDYLTVTDFARFLGMSGSHFLSIAM